MAAAGENENGAARVVIGSIAGVHGIRGWLKVFSHTRPRENIFTYSPWLVETAGGWREYRLLEGRVHGKGLIARLEGLEDRDAARALTGAAVAIHREQMPPLAEGEYYWCDLIGCTVVNLEGRELGRVTEIRETGANDVLVVEGEERQLLPLVMEKIVQDVDLDRRRIRVDWHGG